MWTHTCVNTIKQPVGMLKPVVRSPVGMLRRLVLRPVVRLIDYVCPFIPVVMFVIVYI